MKRTSALLSILAVIALALAAACAPAAVNLDDKSLEARARAVQAKVLTVDTHCDTAMSMTRANWDVGERHEPGKPGSGKGIRWVSALRWKSASMIRMASRAHCRLSLMVVFSLSRPCLQGSANKLRKKPTSRTGTAEVQYARQLLGSGPCSSFTL